MNLEDFDTNMVLDIDNFDFNSIDDGNASVPVEEETLPEQLTEEEVEEFEDEDYEEQEDEEDDELASEDKINSIKEFAEQFEDLPDDLTFKLGDAAFTKADLVKTIKAKEEVDEAHEAFTSFVENLNVINQRQELYVRGSMSETEMKLAEINQALANPATIAPSKLQALLEAKNSYEQRHAALEQNLMKVMEDNKARKDASNLGKIRQTDLMMRGTPGYTGINTIRDLAQWAQKEGINGDAIVEGMSPQFIQILMDAKKFREEAAGRKERIKKAVASPTSVTSKKKAAPTKNTSAQKEKVLKAVQEGKASVGDLWDYLED